MRVSFKKAPILLAVLLAVSVFLASPHAAKADTLYISPASGSYTPGQTFSAKVFVSSLAQSVNAVSGTVSFPTDKLQVVSVSKAGSILTLWVQDPSFSNAQGTVSFEGVVPNPGFTGSAGNIVTISFRVVGQGTAQLKWSSGSVLANDGQGTNILKNLGTATFTLGSSQVPAAAPAPTAAASDEPETDPLAPKAPKVTSSTYPDGKSWYAVKDGKFSWSKGSDSTATRVLLGRLPKSVPTVVYAPAISSKDISDIEDGVWYLHVQEKNSHGWGAIAHYSFKVDTASPESFTIKAAGSDPTSPEPKFSFLATDETSGIDHYSVQIDSGAPAVWRDDGSGIYVAPPLGPGEHVILAKAVDEAGNSTAASLDFSIQGIDAPHIGSYTEQVTDESPLLVKGTALPGAKVAVRLMKDGKAAYEESVSADDKGAFTAVFDQKLASGAYKLVAVATDRRGAQSEPSTEKTVLVKTAWIVSVGAKLMSTLAVVVPVVALLVALVLLVLFLYGRVRVMRAKLRKELRSVERMVDKAFALLKEDVEDSIHLLEHTKSKRKLTEEEDAIIARLRKNISEAEKVIHKEVEEIERQIER